MAARSRPLASTLQDLSKLLAAESDDSAGASQSAERETIVERMRSVLIAVLKRCTQPGATQPSCSVQRVLSPAHQAKQQMAFRAIRLQGILYGLLSWLLAQVAQPKRQKGQLCSTLSGRP